MIVLIAEYHIQIAKQPIEVCFSEHIGLILEELNRGMKSSLKCFKSHLAL